MVDEDGLYDTSLLKSLFNICTYEKLSHIISSISVYKLILIKQWSKVNLIILFYYFYQKPYEMTFFIHKA